MFNNSIKIHLFVYLQEYSSVNYILIIFEINILLKILLILSCVTLTIESRLFKIENVKH